MKYFASLLLLLMTPMVWLSAAQAANTDVFIKKNEFGAQEVLAVSESGTESRLGQLEVLPKGTRLYHWEKASDSQIKKWNSEGKISSERLRKLKDGRGFAGGGYYVSQSPLDSNNYGNTLVVVELPKDILLLRVSSGSELTSWPGVIPGLEAKGISGISVLHSPTWINMIDIEALSKIHVGTEQDLLTVKLDKYERPWNYKKLFEVFPNLESNPNFKTSNDKMNEIMKQLKKPSDSARLAVEEIAESGSMNLVTEVLKKAALQNISDNAIHNVAQRGLYESFRDVIEKMDSDVDRSYFAIGEGFKSNSIYINSIVSNKLTAMDQKLGQKTDVSKRTAMLQSAMEYWGKNLPPLLEYHIAVYKQYSRQWLPHPLCRTVFE
ncbi:MAG: hypothetical protein J7501_00510 [Bdellovibrio sp.]|nr:hypothetical protein [Bdellovibrio sp.]